MDAKIGNFLSVSGYGLAGVLGVVAANYIDSAVGVSTAAPYVMMGAGAVVTAIPAYFMRSNTGAEGLVRLLLGVAGITMILRGAVAAANYTLPTPFKGILQ